MRSATNVAERIDERGVQEYLDRKLLEANAQADALDASPRGAIWQTATLWQFVLLALGASLLVGAIVWRRKRA